ncbi:AAA family ATPase [Armatimonas rosea]|uniref:Putative ABC-type ATPase n=1 Tax=Armatimonas rosea TaxID=685828 RepID=A0A7W9SUF7_ARMRO|nr:AAA family ATPase [Armatimonas rosea]MBB6052600.1 putative ABC-type ATPase [Armatimonas rosea]
MPRLIILAGPNGSGKSTIARTFLPEGMPYLNADEIAKELRLTDPDGVEVRAGRLLLERLDLLAGEGRDFALETTLSGRALAVRVVKLREQGYQVHLYFLYLPSPELAVARVRQRVRTGGHSIPEKTIRRRWESGLRCFYDLYQPLADEWLVVDNTTLDDPGVIAYGTTPQPAAWRQMRANYVERRVKPTEEVL